jgi:hypothetical protein
MQFYWNMVGLYFPTLVQGAVTGRSSKHPTPLTIPLGWLIYNQFQEHRLIMGVSGKLMDGVHSAEYESKNSCPLFLQQT